MSTDPLAFRKQVRQAATPEESLRVTLHGIAEEIEARLASPTALRELAESLRTSADEIFDDVFETPEVATWKPGDPMQLPEGFVAVDFDKGFVVDANGVTPRNASDETASKKKKAREKAIV